MDHWYAGSTQGAIYYGTVGVPSIGGKSGIDIPASSVGLDGATITRVEVENTGGKIRVDAIGKQTP